MDLFLPAKVNARLDHSQLNKNNTSLQAAFQSSDGAQASQLYDRINCIYRRLHDLASFEPDEQTNAVFNDLVGFIVETQVSKGDLYNLMQMPNMIKICEEIRTMCAEAETLLEKVRSQMVHGGVNLRIADGNVLLALVEALIDRREPLERIPIREELRSSVSLSLLFYHWGLSIAS
jgi:hypothetical protein